MKVKALKILRKRFQWRFLEGQFVVLDFALKSSFTVATSEIAVLLMCDKKFGEYAYLERHIRISKRSTTTEFYKTKSKLGL